jgi:hypothetical protein
MIKMTKICYCVTTANHAIYYRNALENSFLTLNLCLGPATSSFVPLHSLYPFLEYQHRLPATAVSLPRIAYSDLRSLDASTSFAAAISGLVISLLPSVCELVSSELVNGFFIVSLSFSVVVL